jgi:RNA polymerase sigma-70 factor (ECF subfamily)
MANQAGQSSDDALVLRVCGGDDDAFEELMSRYKRSVLNFAYRMLGDAGEAEDVTQETFVRAYRRIRRYRPSAKFSTWLFALARNAAIDRLRYRRRHPTDPLPQIVAADTVGGPSAEAEAHEIGELVAAAIALLPEDQRTAVVLAEYHGLSCAEIAGIMGCSEKSVESRLYRARSTLREKLRGFL